MAPVVPCSLLPKLLLTMVALVATTTYNTHLPTALRIYTHLAACKWFARAMAEDIRFYHVYQLAQEKNKRFAWLATEVTRDQVVSDHLYELGGPE